MVEEVEQGNQSVSGALGQVIEFPPNKRPQRATHSSIAAGLMACGLEIYEQDALEEVAEAVLALIEHEDHPLTKERDLHSLNALVAIVDRLRATRDPEEVVVNAPV